MVTAFYDLQIYCQIICVVYAYNVFIVKGDFRMGNKRNEEEYIGRENGKDIFRNEYGDYVRFVSTEEKDMESSILDGIDTNEDIEGGAANLQAMQWNHVPIMPR